MRCVGRARGWLGRAVLALLPCLCASSVLAEWPPLGRSLCSGCTSAYGFRLAPDGAGGLYVLWTDYRNYATLDEDIYMQRVLANGDIAPGWPVTALPICDTTRTQYALGLIPDDAGGALAVWYDERAVSDTSFGSSRDLFAQRVRPDASLAPGWQRLGSPVTRAPHVQWAGMSPTLAPDGAGGALVVWEDWLNLGNAQRTDVFLQHLTGIGVPGPGWPVDGRLVSDAPDYQHLTMVASDGAGGAFLAWEDYRNLPGDYDRLLHGQTFVTRVLADGSGAPGWLPGGQPLVLPRSRPAGIVPDGVGGVYVVYIPTDPVTREEKVVAAQRLTAFGSPAPGWPADGLILCDAPGTRNIGPSCGDGLGGLLVSWAGAPGSEVYLTRIRPDGTLPPGWPEDGLRVSGLEPTPYGEYDPVIAPDGQGGCYVAWAHPTGCCREALIQHILPTGTIAPGWPASGLKVQSVHTSATDLALVADGSGGAILVFGSPSAPYAQRFGPDGVVAAAVSLVGAEARSDAVELRWFVGGEPNFTAALERRTAADGGWRVLAEVAADGTGAILYTDRAVSPGERYAYRLRWSEHGAARTTTETWVETPTALRFALHGLQPNPSRGEAYASFTLPARAGGELELLDVGGRRVLAREIGTLGPGRHVVRLDERAPVPPGLYLLRLRWSDRVATARAIVMR